MAQYCASIGRGNFPRLTEENIAKLEEEFRAQTEDMSKQVETRCKGADFLSEADRKKLACYEDAIAADYVDPRSSIGGPLPIGPEGQSYKIQKCWDVSCLQNKMCYSYVYSVFDSSSYSDELAQ